jgi:hypothetical protein
VQLVLIFIDESKTFKTYIHRYNGTRKKLSFSNNLTKRVNDIKPDSFSNLPSWHPIQKLNEGN